MEGSSLAEEAGDHQTSGWRAPFPFGGMLRQIGGFI